MPTVKLLISLPDMNEERAYAADQLLGFLQHVGPVEAVWAMTTALEALEELPDDHVAVAAAAFGEALADLTEPAAVEPAPSL